jgi:hypothetical protein
VLLGCALIIAFWETLLGFPEELGWLDLSSTSLPNK